MLIPPETVISATPEPDVPPQLLKPQATPAVVKAPVVAKPKGTGSQMRGDNEGLYGNMLLEDGAREEFVITARGFNPPMGE